MGKTNFNQSKQNMKQVGSIPTDALFQIFDKSNKKPYSASIQQLLSMTGGGGGLPSIETFQQSGIDITSSVVNAEDVNLYVFDFVLNDIVLTTFKFTGTIWNTSLGGVDFTWAIGEAMDSTGMIFISGNYTSVSQTGVNIVVSYDKFSNGTLNKITAIKSYDIPLPGDNYITLFTEMIQGGNEILQDYNTYTNNIHNALYSSYHINFDQLTTNASMSVSAQNTDGIHYYTPYQYTEIDISSAEILNLGTNPIELLPAPGVGKYYEHVISLEYTYNTSTYTPLRLEIVCGGVVAVTDGGFLGALENRATVISNSNIGESISLNTNVILRGEGSSNPTNGDGTLKVKIWYRIVNFG